MKYISVDAVPRLVAAILADLNNEAELDDLVRQVIHGNFEKVIKLLKFRLDCNTDLLLHVDDDISDINKLHAAYEFLVDTNRKREIALLQTKETYTKLEELLWLNLKEFNRLRNEYSDKELREIFDKNLGDPRICEECNKMFIATSPRQKFCSVECRRKAAGKRRDDSAV